MNTAERRRSPGLSRFFLAVRAVAWLAKEDSICPSVSIADGMHTHATFLRRLFAPLVRGGVAEVHEGRVGGYALARRPNEITLAEIYQLTRGQLGATSSPAADDLIGGADAPVIHALEDIVRLGEASFVDTLSRYTIADLVQRASDGEAE